MTESTASTTESEEPFVDPVTVDDNEIANRMKKNLSKRTFNPDWTFVPSRKRAPDDGEPLGAWAWSLSEG